MYYPPEICTLKDGLTLTLRSPTEADAPVSLAYLKAIMGETEFLSAYEDEISGELSRELAFICGKLDEPRALDVSAFDSCGAIVGDFDLRPLRDVCRYAHRCELGISVRRNYWGCGLGSALMTVMLREAKALGYEQVELEVVAQNARAIALYQKFGFVQTGTLPHFYKYRDGRYADALYMVRML